jgi:hypothetical protein
MYYFLFRFPSDLNQRYRWIEACKLDDTFFNTSSRICSLHFKHEYFKTKCLRRILYPGSVPTIFTEEEMKNNRNMSMKFVIFIYQISKFSIIIIIL